MTDDQQPASGVVPTAPPAAATPAGPAAVPGTPPVPRPVDAPGGPTLPASALTPGATAPPDGPRPSSGTPGGPTAAPPSPPLGTTAAQQISVPTDSAPPPGAPAPSRNGLWRWIVRLRWPALVLSLITIGATLTYVFAPPTVVGDAPIQVDPAALAAADTVRSQPMPSILGITRAVAQTVLADAGLSGAATTVTERPAAGPAGLVLDQSPPPGADAPDRIELTVSTPAPVPELAGAKLADARATLEQLGAVVQVERVLDPAIPHGQVVSTVPAAGQTAPTVITLRVSDPGDALTLSTVSSVESSSCSTVNQVTVNGATMSGSIECSTTSKRVSSIEYATSRNALAFDAVVGTNDREGTGPATVTVLGDGRVLATVTVELGRSVPVHVDLRDVLRLRLEVTTDAEKNAPDVVFGEAKLIGSKAGLDAIASAR